MAMANDDNGHDEGDGQGVEVLARPLSPQVIGKAVTTFVSHPATDTWDIIKAAVSQLFR